MCIHTYLKTKHPIQSTLKRIFLCFSNMQVKESLLQRFLEMEQTAREQATDNAILDQLQKVYYSSEITSSKLNSFLVVSDWCLTF